MNRQQNYQNISWIGMGSYLPLKLLPAPEYENKALCKQGRIFAGNPVITAAPWRMPIHVCPPPREGPPHAKRRDSFAWAVRQTLCQCYRRPSLTAQNPAGHFSYDSCNTWATDVNRIPIPTTLPHVSSAVPSCVYAVFLSVDRMTS